MSTYFRNVPYVPYRFGDRKTITAHQDLSVYVDLIDQVKNREAFYQKYEIMDGDRPDTLSYRLYNTTAYYWTFFLLNDNLREQGWPLSYSDLLTFVQKKYPNTVLTTQDDITDTYLRGTVVRGVSSGEQATVVERRLEMGHIIVEGDHEFYTDELLTIVGDESTTVALTAAESQYNAVRHYVDSDGSMVGIDPYSGPAETYAAVTWFEHYQNINNDLKQIVVLKPEAIGQIFGEFQEAMKNRYA